MSKSLATIATQPLIVAKVGLQSKPPPSRLGVPFKNFGEVMKFIVKNEGLLGLFKGIGPQISKGLLVQGLLMMTKERWASPESFSYQITDNQTGWNSYLFSSSDILDSSGRSNFRKPQNSPQKQREFCQ